MARQPLDPPSNLGLSISRAIRREMGDRRISGRELARILDKSEGYVRDRVNDRFEFTLGDVDRFAEHLGMDPADFVAEVTGRTDNVTPMRRRVGGSPDDHRAVARPTDPDSGEDT